MEWISINEQLPGFTIHRGNTSERVLILVDGFVTVASLYKKYGEKENVWNVHDNTLDYDYIECLPSHWMPLPQPPKTK